MATLPEPLLKDIKQKKFKPLYLLYGDEPFYIDLIANELEQNVVAESEKSFNQFVMYGKDSSIAGVLGNARRFPFMAERQLVVVKEAQHLPGIKDKDQAVPLEAYCRQPVPSTVLVLCYHEKLDKRKSLVKAFAEHGVAYHSETLYDSKLPEWVRNYCRSVGVKISPQAEQLIVSHIGNDLKRIQSEIHKISVNLKVGETVDAEVIEKYVGISKDYNVFEFQKALGLRDARKANEIASVFISNPKEHPLAAILIILYGFFAKLILTHVSPVQNERELAGVLGVNPYFVKDYVSASRNYPLVKLAQVIRSIRRTDALMKGVDSGSMDEGALLRQLVYDVIH